MPHFRLSALVASAGLLAGNQLIEPDFEIADDGGNKCIFSVEDIGLDRFDRMEFAL